MRNGEGGMESGERRAESGEGGMGKVEGGMGKMRLQKVLLQTPEISSQPCLWQV